MEYRTVVLASAIGFPEDPRWHEGWLYFSDMAGGKVMRVNLSGDMEEVVHVPGIPSGLGWLPDGEMLVVSMNDCRVLRWGAGSLSEHANLAGLASFKVNDMVVDTQGRAYVGTFGFDFENLAAFSPGEVIFVDANGRARLVASGLSFPNGLVLPPGGNRLLVAETFGERVSSFEIREDGSLGPRRTWAELKGTAPDGIALDEENGLWVPSPVSGAVFRVLEGGQITDVVRVERQPYACRLGGPDGRTLFVLTSAPLESLFKLMSKPLDASLADEPNTGRVEMTEVPIAGAGLP